MQKDEGQNMEFYIPRKWLITSKDQESVQPNVGHLDESGPIHWEGWW
ncbi:hypothetical protein H5410_056857 [Solanum commersonii]|uniref:Uncharacterized protein n=1 Tax=Solanum commersonii TaxID=4109 RepID=A0A9J5WLD7_SOLCO|nr:hypothetical protein H5410_056857 [Solanum commersonii]